MKNRHTNLLLILTCVFAVFTLGFLAGRTTAPGDTVISVLPEPTQPAIIAAPTAPGLQAVPTETSEATPSGKININTATSSQLDSLPGIGPVLAQRILDYRQTNGPFTSLGQLSLVEGIGQKTLEALLDLITIE